jgi:uncharacterized Zn-binding protein involved in type VI secretion
MANLELSGRLDLSGNLSLSADGGKVLVGGQEALVELGPTTRPAHCSGAVPVILPPPPASPTDPAPLLNVINSFNKTVKIAGKPIVALGMVMQGNNPSWPGMVLPSQANTGPVTCGFIPVNVVGDQAVVFPTGAPAAFGSSGQ